MLSLYEFISLNNSQRGEILWSEGEFLENVVYDKTGYSLYALFGFYVEVILIENEVAEITPFKQGERFDKYLTRINITELE